MLFNILALISTIFVIILLKRLVNIFPFIIACAARWKNNIKLETSVKNSYDRDIIAVSMVIPFILVAVKFKLYDPAFMDRMNESLRIGVISGIFTAYSIVRILASAIVRTRLANKKLFVTATKAAYTFFIILVILLIALGGILAFVDVPYIHIKSAMLWVSAFIYALFLLRKFQIFASGFSIFASFLYLCALEIIPTGLLIASALIF